MNNKTANRRCPELDGLVVQWPWPEILHLGFSRLGIGNPNAWIRWRNRVFGKWAARHVLDDVDIVWGFDTSSLEVFEEAHRRGIRCVLDMCSCLICDRHCVFDEYDPYLPEVCEWSKPEEEFNIRAREMELADVVVLSSDFAGRSVERYNISPSKIVSNPHGVDTEIFRPCARFKPDLPLKFLYLGSLSREKGVYHALEAWRKANLNSIAQLTLVGGSRKDLTYWHDDLPDGVRILERIPHSQVPEIFRESDVFIFPSFLEGLAKVILEAMASGLPIITTYNSAPSDLIRSGIEGLLTEPGNVDDLVEKMKKIASYPPLAFKMGKAARQRAEEFTWDAYGDRCADICHSLYQEGGGPR